MIEHKDEIGGLSGSPLKSLSLKALSILRSELPSSIPIIGAGGVSSGADALEFARAGASAVQVYTSFGYGGVGTVRRIKDELTDELRRLNTTWVDVSCQAINRLSWKSPSQLVTTTTGSSSDIQALIREAESLKKRLTEVEVRYFPAGDDIQQNSGQAMAAIGESESLRKAGRIDAPLQVIPPPGVIP